MEQGYGGYGTWNAGATNAQGTYAANAPSWQGYEGYDYYNPQTTAANTAATYNYAPGGSGAWETPKGAELGLSAGVAAAVPSYGAEPAPAESSDSIIAKINQRLDMLSKEGSAAGDGLDEQESSFRFESFDSYDSRPSLNDRDVFRPGYDYGDAAAERGDSFGGQFDARRDQSRNRGNNYGLIRGRGQNRAPNRGRSAGFNRSEHLMPSSSSERLSARWNELNYMGGRGMGRRRLQPPPVPLLPSARPRLWRLR
ncbi:hypothetical protein Q9233_016277 [Columba guinea]|nr:hypothetical protein Q9233_016277 [Columba guinea]